MVFILSHNHERWSSFYHTITRDGLHSTTQSRQMVFILPNNHERWSSFYHTITRDGLHSTTQSREMVFILSNNHVEMVFILPHNYNRWSSLTTQSLKYSTYVQLVLLVLLQRRRQPCLNNAFQTGAGLQSQ